MGALVTESRRVMNVVPESVADTSLYLPEPDLSCMCKELDVIDCTANCNDRQYCDEKKRDTQILPTRYRSHPFERILLRGRQSDTYRRTCWVYAAPILSWSPAARIAAISLSFIGT